jgi:predicted HicB family RNase H-like nuclease
MEFVKTTLEVQDAIFRRAKSAAAERGITLREFVTEAVQEKIESHLTKRLPRNLG